MLIILEIDDPSAKILLLESFSQAYNDKLLRKLIVCILIDIEEVPLMQTASYVPVAKFYACNYMYVFGQRFCISCLRNGLFLRY